MEITVNNTFKNYEHFCSHLVNQVFSLHNLQKELLCIDDIDYESEYLTRIYINTTTKSYCIRLWNVFDDENSVYVEYTLYKIDNKTESFEII